MVNDRSTTYFEAAEPVAVERQPVGLRDAPILGLELRDDTEVSDRQCNIDRHLQSDRRVDIAVTRLVVLVIGV